MTIPVAIPAPRGPAFRALVWKELREALKPAAIGFAIVAVGLFLTMGTQKAMSSVDFEATPSVTTLTLFTITCALVGLMLGRAQLLRERRGDAWAFLVHRPVPRATIFWGKAAAGAMLYLAATAIPLAVAWAWLASPGHRALPFEPRMMLADIADLLCGLVYYAAALLVTMRDARWYGSRLLPIGAALVCSAAVISVSRFGAALAIVALGLIVVGGAARALFIAGGRYATQPRAARAARAALVVSLGLGLYIAGGLAVGLASLLEVTRDPELREMRSTSVVVASDGAVVRATKLFRIFGGGESITDVRDLAGHVIPRYADSTARASLTAGVVSAAPVPLNPAGQYAGFFRDRGYRGTEDIFVPLVRALSRTPTPQRLHPRASSMFFMRRLGLVSVFDNRTARHVGWIGPDGFAPGDSPPSHRFEGVLDPYAEMWYSQPLLAFQHDVYRIDVDARTARKVFTAPAGDEVLGAASSGDSTIESGPYTPDRAFDVIATTRNVYVQSTAGAPQLTVPRDPSAAGYGTVTVARALAAPAAPTVLWYKPRYGTLPEAQQSDALDRITLVNSTGGTVATYAVTADSGAAAPPATPWAEVVSSGLSKPPIERVATELKNRFERPSPRSPMRTPAKVEWLLAAFSALICAGVALGVARAYAFESNRRMLWTAIGFLFGPLGVLVMVAAIEWPAREVCAACGRKRVVTHERCEHCGAAFEAPSRDGTEIFEPAA